MTATVQAHQALPITEVECIRLAEPLHSDALLPAVAGAVLSAAAFSAVGTQAKPDSSVLTVEVPSLAGGEPLPLGLRSPLSLTFEPDAKTIPPATAKARRKGYKIMSRRCQMGMFQAQPETWSL